MNHDISQPVPQGSDGAQDAENSRIAAIARGDSLKDVSHFETEQRVAEQMAKANGYWIPMMDVFDLGVPDPSGNETTLTLARKLFTK